MAAWKNTLRVKTFAAATPAWTRSVVAKIPRGMRGHLTELVCQALLFHRDEGHADAARFCMLLLDALRAAEMEDRTTMAS